MELEKFYTFPIDSPLTSAKRQNVDAQIEHISKMFDKEITYKWLKRGEERFLRLMIDPVTVEAIFFSDRVECYGAAPAWAKLFFTKARKEEVRGKLEQILVSAGFITSVATP